MTRLVTRYGSIHVVLANRGGPQDAKFRLTFGDYQSPCGAMAAREVTGENELKDLLIRQIGIRADAVATALPALYGEGNVSFLDVGLSDAKLGELGFLGKDDPAFQRERIRRIAEEVVPDCEIVFDSDKPFSWIKFRLDSRATGKVVGLSGDYHVSEIADWSDSHLRQYVKSIAPFFAR